VNEPFEGESLLDTNVEMSLSPPRHIPSGLTSPSYLIPLIALGSLLWSCGEVAKDNSNVVVYYCDAETISVTDEGTFLGDSAGFYYLSAEQRSHEKAHSGKYSLLLDSNHHFGFGMTVTDVRPGEVFTIESWQSVDSNANPCELVAANEDNSFYHAENTIIGKYGKWLLLRTQVYIPKDFEGEQLSFYVWNKKRITAYVDDFKVIRYHHQTNHGAFDLEKLYIEIKPEGLAHLSTIRDSALVIGILKRGSDDYVPTQIIYQGQKRKGKIRLKGDWTDHLQGDKWSFRIKLNGALKDGVEIFNIQAPHTRYFLSEYVYHKILEKENLLTPEYRFVQVYINDVSYGIYAFEEHLSSRIIERASKPNGIILKFEDKPYWDAMSILKEGEIEGNVIAEADVKVYGKSKKDKACRQDVKDAQLIMEGYQKQDSAVYHSFNIDQMAKYYALCDITRAYHAMGWINIRFYYNFSNKLMEPIGYDAYTAEGDKGWASPYLGYAFNHEKYAKFETEAIVYDVFRHPAMYGLYDQYLNKFSDSLYIRQIMDELESDLDYYETQLQFEYPHYTYDREFLFANARSIKESVAAAPKKSGVID